MSTGAGSRVLRQVSAAGVTGLLLVGTGALTAPASASTSVSAASVSKVFSAAAKAVKKPKVKVPSNYVYDPTLGSLHDYCTNAPDEFPAPFAKNADFRGPCARHDLCYASSTKKSVCDKALKKNLYTNCEYYYGKKNPLRYACKSTALGYWAVVVAYTHKP